MQATVLGEPNIAVELMPNIGKEDEMLNPM
jgi:hypothetical protein